MPSPFPGMDPYLEGSLWLSVHSQLAMEAARQLTPHLFPRYIALTPQRFVVATPDAADAVAVTAPVVVPDAAVVEWQGTRTGPSGSAAVATAPLQVAVPMPESMPQVSVEIRGTANRQLVTAIEVLSPTNKRGDGRKEYLEKRQNLLKSTAHLIEIDLLRRGERMPTVQRLPDVPYVVLLSRANRRPVADVWPVRLDQPLPRIPVPLLPGDADVPLDLQAVLTSVYDGFGYAAAIDYTKPAEVPLTAEQAEWAATRVRPSGAGPNGAGDM